MSADDTTPLPLDELARHTDTSRHALYSLVGAGRLEHTTTVNGTVLASVADVERCRARQAAGGPVEAPKRRRRA
jgi:hypothetical protein